MIDFASDAGTSSGAGFRLVAEELTTGCGGVLHGMVGIKTTFDETKFL